MVIDGDWGTGKTEFCEKLIELMQQEQPDYQVVYVDAFRSDHSGEPLLALLAQIIKDCTPEDGHDGVQSEERKQFIKKIAKIAGFTFKTIAKAAAGHILKQSVESLAEGFQQAAENEQEAESTTETVSDTLVELSDKAIDSTVEVLLKEQIEAEKNLEALRECLRDFSAGNSIILFVDELDRCRPDYAVEMLETIKHVFDVPNVKVVLVTNTQQLRAAINHRYGSAVDSQRYLDKFLKYSFHLPEKVLGKHSGNAFASVTYFSKLVQESNILKDTELNDRDNENVRSFAKDLIGRNELSLREVETFIRYLEIYHLLSNGLAADIVFGCQLLRITGVFVFCFKPEIAESIKKNQTNGKQIASLFGISELPDYQSERYRHSYADIVAVMLAQASVSDNEVFFSADERTLEYWKEYKDMCFRGEYRLPRDIFIIIQYVINFLQLGNDRPA